MFTAGGARRRAPMPWHERLKMRLQDLEDAAAALLAVCEEPGAAAMLEVRARATARGAAHAAPALYARQRLASCMYAPRPQDCNLGFASAAAARLLESTPLLRRLELASDTVLSARSTLASARGALAPRAGAASEAGSGHDGILGFAHLPHAVVRHILSYVPADARARAAIVCRAWRDTVADTSLWTVLDLSPASGVCHPRAAWCSRCRKPRCGAPRRSRVAG